MLITIQVVNFNSRSFLKNCLESIRKNVSEEMETEIILINNETKALSSGEDYFSGVKILEAKENLGFGRAHNLGAKSARGKYILFLNPDAKILDGSLSRLVSVLEAHKKNGIAGPRLVGESGGVEEEHAGAEKNLFSLVKSKLFFWRKKIDSISFHPLKVDWISGGAMLVKRDLFFELGGFDENFFLYFEDVDLCRRARKRGHEIILDPKAVVFHKSGQSFSNNQSKKKQYYASQDYYLKKNFGPFWAGIAKLLRLPFYVKNVYLRK